MGVTTNKTGSKWANAKEVEFDQAPFFKFEQLGEAVEGLLIRKVKIVDSFKNENEHFILKVQGGEEVTLPCHFQLNNKLNKVFDENKVNEVYIEYTGSTPVKNGTAANYKVLSL